MKPTTPTRVAAALDKLVELVEADAAFAEVRVFDGAPLVNPDEADVIVFAPSTPDQPGIDVSYDREPGLGNAYVERVAIVATISCWTGDTDPATMRAQRARVVALHGALCALLAANRTVADCWDDVGLGEAAEWYLVASESGTTAALGFAILSASVV